MMGSGEPPCKYAGYENTHREPQGKNGRVYENHARGETVQLVGVISFQHDAVVSRRCHQQHNADERNQKRGDMQALKRRVNFIKLVPHDNGEMNPGNVCTPGDSHIVNGIEMS